MRLLKQIHNIKTEIKGGNMRPDSTCIEKPVEAICTTMISANETENNLYWKPLNESQLDQAVMCYINSHSTSTIERLSQTHNQSQTPDCIHTMPTELAEIDGNNAFAQKKEDNSTEDILISPSRKHFHDSDSTKTSLKKQACSFENDDKDFLQNFIPEQLPIYKSHKHSHSSYSIADTVLKKQSTSSYFENNEKDFPKNSEELQRHGTVDTEYYTEGLILSIPHNYSKEIRGGHQL